MKTVGVFALVLLAVAVVTAEDDKYTTKYDNVDLDDILKNKRLLKNYVFCLLEKGNCSPDGQELKKVLPDALKTECSKCSEKQKTGTKKVLRHLIDHEPEWWTELEDKYDKTGDYKKKYLEEDKEKKA